MALSSSSSTSGSTCLLPVGWLEYLGLRRSAAAEHRQRTALSSGRDRHFAEPPAVILGGVILGTIAGLLARHRTIDRDRSRSCLVAITVPAEISPPLMVSLVPGRRIRRQDLRDPAEHPGRSRCHHDHPRRTPDGAQRRRRPLRCRSRLSLPSSAVFSAFLGSRVHRRTDVFIGLGLRTWSLLRRGRDGSRCSAPLSSGRLRCSV